MRRALSCYQRFPLVNHGKPYIIDKQRAYGVRHRGAWLSVRNAASGGCINRRERFVRGWPVQRRKNNDRDRTIFSLEVALSKVLIRGSSAGRDSIKECATLNAYLYCRIVFASSTMYARNISDWNISGSSWLIILCEETFNSILDNVWFDSKFF